MVFKSPINGALIAPPSFSPRRTPGLQKSHSKTHFARLVPKYRWPAPTYNFQALGHLVFSRHFAASKKRKGDQDNDQTQNNLELINRGNRSRGSSSTGYGPEPN